MAAAGRLGRWREALREAAGGRSRDDRELGQGVWRRLHDRFRRAVDRYHQVIEPVPASPLRDDLERAGGRLAACLDAVRAACVDAQSRVPSGGLEVPGAARAEHAALSRAATMAAQAAEAAAMARVRGPAADARAVERAVLQVEALVLPGPPPPPPGWPPGWRRSRASVADPALPLDCPRLRTPSPRPALPLPLRAPRPIARTSPRYAHRTPLPGSVNVHSGARCAQRCSIRAGTTGAGYLGRHKQ